MICVLVSACQLLWVLAEISSEIESECWEILQQFGISIASSHVILYFTKVFVDHRLRLKIWSFTINLLRGSGTDHLPNDWFYLICMRNLNFPWTIESVYLNLAKHQSHLVLCALPGIVRGQLGWTRHCVFPWHAARQCAQSRCLGRVEVEFVWLGCTFAILQVTLLGR